VASPVGAAVEILVPGAGGVLARSMSEWYDALAGLAGDGRLRSATAAAARQRVESEYSVAVNAPRLAAALAATA
jgi:glycosyltransferase involved in cell wall biosynthesis